MGSARRRSGSSRKVVTARSKSQSHNCNMVRASSSLSTAVTARNVATPTFCWSSVRLTFWSAVSIGGDL